MTIKSGSLSISFLEYFLYLVNILSYLLSAYENTFRKTEQSETTPTSIFFDMGQGLTMTVFYIIHGSKLVWGCSSWIPI